MRLKFKIVTTIIIASIGIQFIPVDVNVSTIEPTKNFVEVFDAPLKVSEILSASCYDCHSNNTNYPWYSKIQPVGLIMGSHIREGKEELNFSEFGSYSSRRQKNKIESIINEISNDKMPLPSYLILHSEAKIDTVEKEILIEYVKSICL